MSRPKGSLPVKLIVSLITKGRDIIRPVLYELQKEFGNIDFISEKMGFHHTAYYEDEMGKGLFRKMASFENLIKPDMLPDIKVLTNSIEERYSENGKRRINIDPGYISMEKMVLASFKNFSHRIYLSKGVYADLTLIYKQKNFRSLEWTFPDYAGQGMKDLLNGLRERYMLQLRVLGH